jgi:hypothetical protein
MRYSASSPQLLGWLDRWNASRPYDEQIRPFGFMLSYTAKTGCFAKPPEAVFLDAARRGRPRKDRTPKPIAPFSRQAARSVEAAFDRISGEPVDTEGLKSYSDALAQYHLSPEGKFENGRHLDRGRTERRHVVATAFVLIGKEANQVGESGEADPILDAFQIFGRPA